MRPDSPAGVGGIQGAHDFQLNHSSISVVGGDNHTHTHVYYHGTIKDVKAILGAIYNFRKIHQDTLAKVTPGTVKWLFVSQFFKVWWNKSGEIKILWGSGIPGAGKTVLVSLVINEIERRVAEAQEPICVAYFFMRYSEHGQVSVRNVLEVLVKQTVERHQDLLPLAAEVYDQHVREGTEPTEAQLLALLEQFIAHMAITFYILDALDEGPFEIQHALIEKLASLNARLLITSRPMQDVQAYFPEAHCFEIAAHDQDLDLHIAKKLQGNPRLRTLLDRGEASVKQRMISMVKLKSGGMFLHASLQLDALGRCLNVHSVMQTLERFPARIEDVYTHTWERILNQDPDHAALAQLALVWVLYAKRSLTIGELCRAIATCPETHSFEEGRLVPESTITDLCYGLLTVDKQSQLVRLVHYTAQKPLKDFLRVSFPQLHSLLAAVCVARLADCGFQNTTTVSEDGLNTVLAADSLLDYAYNSWVLHTRESLDLGFVPGQVSAFIARCRAFPVIFYNGHHPQCSPDTPHIHHRSWDTLSALHVVACYNLPIALAGPQDAHGTNAGTNKQNRTPLHLACLLGHRTSVQSLLSLPDIHVNARDRKGKTALILTRRKVGGGIIKLLLAHPNINTNEVDNLKRTALIWASRRGDQIAVKLLLAHPEVEVNLADRGGETALILASRYRHKTIVKLLLAHPSIDVNLADKYGYTALLVAIESRAYDHNPTGIVQLLLACPTIQINLATPHGSTALLLASQYGHITTVERLLTVPGIEVNAADKDNDTAIKMAAQSGHVDVVRTLLRVPGIKTTVKSTLNGYTAISAAVAMGHHSIVQHLHDFALRNTNLPSGVTGKTSEMLELVQAESM